MAISFTGFSEESLDQAIAWIARLRSDQVTESDQADFALWLSESEQHQAAFDEAMVLWESTGVVSSTMPDDNVQKAPSEISAYLSKHPQANQLTASNDHTVVHSSQSKWHSKALAIAASVFVAVILLFNTDTLQQTFSGDSSPVAQASVDEISVSQQLYATAVGESQTFILEDGSSIQLNTNSKVTVEYSDNLRHLTLISGEAYFDVAHDPKRPFRVSTKNGTVTAIGTAFNIQQFTESDALVAVTEGVVEIALDLSGQSLDEQQLLQQALQMHVGKQVVISKGKIGNEEHADLDRLTAWRNKTLVFKDTDLAQALKELNRYLKTPVDISHQSLDQLRISGTFSIEEPEATLNAIIASFELQSYQSPVNEQTRLFKGVL